jgi:hypothetical protein
MPKGHDGQEIEARVAMWSRGSVAAESCESSSRVRYSVVR